jgi:hypothetical protein
LAFLAAPGKQAASGMREFGLPLAGCSHLANTALLDHQRRGLARSCTFDHLEFMNERIANILEQVHELTASERAELIDALTDVAGAEVLDPVYLKEIKDRLAAYDRGEVEGLDAYEITMRGPATT